MGKTTLVTRLIAFEPFELIGGLSYGRQSILTQYNIPRRRVVFCLFDVARASQYMRHARLLQRPGNNSLTDRYIVVFGYRINCVGNFCGLSVRKSVLENCRSLVTAPVRSPWASGE